MIKIIKLNAAKMINEFFATLPVVEVPVDELAAPVFALFELEPPLFEPPELEPPLLLFEFEEDEFEPPIYVDDTLHIEYASDALSASIASR